MGLLVCGARVDWGRVVGLLAIFGVFCGALGGSVSAQVTAPSDGERLDATWVLVGDSIEVDIAPAFVGTVETYRASSDRSSVATVSLDGSVVTVTGVTAGTAGIQLSARNSAGTEYGYFPVTVLEADDAPVVRCCFGRQRPTAGGAAATWDASQRFMGPVDSYAVTVDRSFPTGGGDDPVLSASVTDSTITVTPLRQGFALLTVSATNTNGTSTLGLTVHVDEATTPPTTTTTTVAAAPAASGTLDAQTVTAGNSEDVDVAAGFTGSVDSYSATSSDDMVLTVSTSASVVTLSGVAPGSATVTVTATNTTGSATQTIAVTVEALAAPELGAALTAQTVAVGDSADVDVTAGFAGSVDSYGAASSDETVATVSVDGATVTVTGVAAGTTTVSVTATNATGSVSQSFTVTVSELVVTATAPTYCLTGEGRPVIVTPGTTAAASRTTAPSTTTVGREGVATVDVSYTISGGRGPYTVTIPDATPARAGTGGTSAARAAAPGPGVMAVSCALPGVNLDNVTATANVVEAGPKTIRLKVTDANGATATATVTIQVAEDAYTTEYNDGIMRAGRSYVLGDSDAWALITLPAGLDLRFGGISHIGSNGAAHFFDTVSGSEIVLDWGTGAEFYRNVVAPPARSSEQTPRDVGALFSLLRGSVSEPQGVEYDGSEGNNWRPYPDLPGKNFVAVHPSILTGDPIRVCNKATRTYFSSDEMHRDFNDAFVAAVDAWNGRLHVPGDATTGTPSPVFERSTDCRANSFDILVYRNMHSQMCGTGDSGGHALGCANTQISGNTPPIIGGGAPGDYWIYVVMSHTLPLSFETVLLHELGHYVGLGDYRTERDGCTSESEKSVMAYPVRIHGQLVLDDCGWNSLTDRDLSDAHAVYHPDVLRSALLVNDGGWMITGVMPRDTARRAEFNAHRLVVWSRLLGSDGAYLFERAFEMDSAALSGTLVRLPFVSGFDATGREFLVAGVTRGDPKRRTTDADGSPTQWVAHADVTAAELAGVSWVEGVSWTLGDTVPLAGPPRAPRNVRAVADGASVDVSWDAVPGTKTYRVLWNTFTFTDPDDTLDSVRVPGTATSWPISGLETGKTHYFRVEASSGVHDSELSAVATATPGVSPPEPPSSLAIQRSRSSVTEAPGVGRSAVITATLNRAAVGSAASVVFTVIRHGGANGDDYVVSPSGLQVTVPEGGSTAELEVEAVNDSDSDAGEWLQFSATATGGGIAGTLTSVRASVVIDDNEFTVWIDGVSACVTGELVTMTARVLGNEGSPTFVWGGAVAGFDTSSIEFRCPTAGSPTITVTATDRAEGTGTDTHTLTVISPPPAPTTLIVGVATTTASLLWSEVSTADDYVVSYSDGNSSGSKTTTDPFTSFAFLRPWTEYTFEVRARNAAGSSAAISETRRTSAEITGQVAAVKLDSTSGPDVEFGFRPSGEARIEPARRGVTYADLEVGRYRTSSDVIRTAATPAQTLGRITVTLSTTGRVLVCFIPDGGSRRCPGSNAFPYLTATVNRWLYSDAFTFTITEDAAGTRTATDAATMAGPSALDAAPIWDTTEGQMEDDNE